MLNSESQSSLYSSKITDQKYGGHRRGFISGMLRSLDRFGYPITLTWKDQNTFKTTFGGVMTVLSVISIFIYLGIMLSTAIEETKYTITSASYIRNLYLDNTSYPLTEENFDFALQLAYQGPPVNGTLNLFQYFSISMF